MAATPSDHAVAAAKTDADLLAALADDPSSALGSLYDRYGGLVYGLAMKMLGAPSEAEDLTQEIFLTLCTQWNYDAARGSLSAFLVTLTRSRAIDKMRARTRKTRSLDRWGEALIPNDPVPSPLETLSIGECSARVRAAMADLPETQRRVLEMAYYRDLSQTEIATELAAPLGTVKSWMRRGLLSLRDSLAPFVG
jgi:RNA polymerase sigma-70 factor (ECF subfamily)